MLKLCKTHGLSLEQCKTTILVPNQPSLLVKLPPPATRSLRKPLVPASEEPWASDLQEKKATGGSSQLLWRMIFNNLSWVNYNSSLT